ncbi:ABC transporter permease [Phaeobacter piscinae]|uniref:ABC transporter permease n=1 Tax=Phaeobacter piscinae TaxID=1580596 RepID=UPI00058ECA34|nr:ABC transporter permease [Phaeobacter piscinae]UTS82635.1 Dipeptide transport system permease protein DppB [Phaeobacter piscinae]
MKQKLLFSVGLVVCVVILNFFLIRMAPGDPAITLAGQAGGADEATLAHIRKIYGLDKPIWNQFFVYVGKMLTGDLGTSYFYNLPVRDLILERVFPTVLLVISSLLISVGIGTFMGVLAAHRPRGMLSYFVTFFSLGGYSLPTFWLGQMLLLAFAWYWPIFPIGGVQGFRVEGFFPRVADVAMHLVLPAITLGLAFMAQYSRVARASMLEVLGSDYIRTARAKGAKESTVLFVHGLRNAILPVITLAGLQLGQILSGAVLVETVFDWPGLGRLAVDSIFRRDYPTILGILFASAVVVAVINILTDVVYRWADPRLRAGGGH